MCEDMGFLNYAGCKYYVYTQNSVFGILLMHGEMIHVYKLDI